MLLRSRLFIVSYAPLFLMLIFQNWPDNFGANWSTAFVSAMLIASLVGFGDAINIIKGAQRTSTFQLRVTDIQDEGANAAGYLATYLIPFISADFDRWNTIATYVIFFLVLYVIFVRSNFGLANPTLYMLKWRTFQAITVLNGQPKRITILSKSVPQDGLIDAVRSSGGYIIKESQ